MTAKLASNTKLVIIISSVVSIMLVLIIAFNANRYINRMSRNNSELYSAFKISELMKLFRNNIVELETKQRGYLVTGDPKFLEAFKLKETEAKTYLKSMEKYFSGKPEEETFYKLKDLTYKKIIEGKDLNHSNDGLPVTKPQAEIETMDEINTTIDEINNSLSITTKKLLDNSVEYVDASNKWGYLEIAIGIITALLAVFFLLRDLAIRNRLQEELKAAKLKADQNALMKEQFMANMSHEIRTPMNAIVGFSDLLKKTQLDKTQADYLSAIKTSGSNLLNIINDILDFSKIEAGKLHIEKISFSVISVIDSLKTMFSEKAAEKRIDLKINIDTTIPSLLFGDPTRLTQVLVNLLGNAVKFTSKGEVSLSCEIKSIEHDIAQLIFRVKDTGIGIPQDKISDVFERFNQGNAATTRKFGGTGLGLAIVKNLVEIQNGEITIKSKKGVGTEFIVLLSYPVSYENVNILSENKEEELIIYSDVPLKILLAEDNALNQKLATTHLVNFGLEVDIAENGEIAINKAKQENYSLILMDIQMPVMDGYAAAKALREEIKINIPLIAMTANIMEGEREKCLSIGMNDYISKPFSEKELFDMLIKYIGTNKKQYIKTEIQKNQQPFDSAFVDLEQIFSLSRGNNNFIKEITDIFLEQNPKDIRELENAIQENDFITLRAVAHRMKTSVGFMGMKPLLEPLTIIEKNAEAKSGMQEIKTELVHIRASSAIAIEELKQVLLNLKTS